MIKLLFLADRSLVETRPEYRYAIVNQALRNFTFGFTDHTIIDEFWWSSDPEEVLKKLKVTDIPLFWKSYNRQDTPDFRKQLTKPYPDVDELEQARKKKIILILLAHDYKELASASLEKLPKLDDVICIPRDTPDYEKKIEEAIQGALKKRAVKAIEALMVSNLQEDLEAAEKNHIKSIYIERKGVPPLKRKEKIKNLSEIKSFL
ncbi:MAG TPA: HAD hydrolase-like protein [Candidatus Nanoarchaeia archaeon]|nr:HAD hydrolase-like protein [Candidatus Nanoarchaeia archaeon]